MLQDYWPLVLLGLRIGVALALYLFLLTAVRALRAEVRARTMPLAGPLGGSARARGTRPAPRPAVATATRARVPAPSPREPHVEVVPRPSADRLEVVAYDGEPSEAPAFTGRTFVLDGPALIGRGAGNTIVLPERHVSARHARLVPEDGAWWVEDLGSTNGTYVGRHRVAGRARLEPADEVRFGPVVARLVRSRVR
ncbi:MAG: FHA domain-containing protein [Dehalococcoidia bacterium]